MFDTIRYQQRGLEPSSLTGPFTVEAHVADAVAVLDALEIERAWLVGHSWGAHLAMHIAVAHPDRVLGLVLIGMLGALGDGGAAGLDVTLSARYEAHHGRPLPADAELRDIWPFYFSSAEAAPPYPPLRISSTSGETFASANAHLNEGTLAHALPSLNVPVIVIHGVEDPIPVAAAADTARLIPGAVQDMIDGCGHFPWIERPGRVRDDVAQLLSTRARGPVVAN